MTPETTTQTTKPAVFLAKYHDITAFASTDDRRFAIQGVHYNSDEQRMEATDGMIAIRVPVVQPLESFPAIGGTEAKSVSLPTSTLKKALANIPKSHQPELCHAKLSVDGKATLTTTDLENEQSISVKPIDSPFPNLNHVWPTETPKFSVALSADLLKRLAAYAEQYGLDETKKKTGVVIRFDFVDNLAAVRASFPIADPLGQHPKAEALLMPVRLT